MRRLLAALTVTFAVLASTRSVSREPLVGWLVATSDSTWEGETRPLHLPGPWPFWDKIPPIPPSAQVSRRQKVFVLLVFQSAVPDSAGQAYVSYDVNFIRPDGSSSLHYQSSIKYYPGNESKYILRLLIKFVGDYDEPAGTWRTTVILKDEVDGVSVPLQTSFVLAS
jgi:hypothetical protein